MGKNKVFFFVLACGAVGGLLSWVYTLAVGDRMSLAGWQAVGASVVLGVGASWIGVYLLAHTDTSDLTRALAFALLCGFAWKPVFDAGTAMVERRREVKAAQKVAALDEAIGKLSEASDPEQVEAVTRLAKEALEKASAADRRSLDRRVSETVEKLATLAESPWVPPASAARLAEVGEAALENGYPDTAQLLAVAFRDAAQAPAGDEMQIAASFEAIDQMSAAAAREAPEMARPLAYLGGETALELFSRKPGDVGVDASGAETTAQLAPEQRREILGRAVGRLEDPLSEAPVSGELRELDESALEVRLHIAMEEPPGAG